MRKLFSGLLAALGAGLMVLTLVLCLLSLNAQPKILEFPQQASTLAQNFATALNQGDLDQAGGYIYGQPALTAGADWTDEAKEQIWQAYTGSLRCSPSQEPTATDQGIDWTVEIQYLDVAALMDAWQAQTNALLTGSEEAPDAQLALSDGLSQALAEDQTTLSQELTLHLIFWDGQWWISPDTALLQLLSGQV